MKGRTATFATAKAAIRLGGRVSIDGRDVFIDDEKIGRVMLGQIEKLRKLIIAANKQTFKDRGWP